MVIGFPWVISPTYKWGILGLYPTEPVLCRKYMQQTMYDTSSPIPCATNWENPLELEHKITHNHHSSHFDEHIFQRGCSTTSYLGVSENGGTPKSSISIGISIINRRFWGPPIFGNTHLSVKLFGRPMPFIVCEPKYLGLEVPASVPEVPGFLSCSCWIRG